MKSEEDSSRSMVIFAVEEVSFFLFADLENIGLIHACTIAVVLRFKRTKRRERGKTYLRRSDEIVEIAESTTLEPKFDIFYFFYYLFKIFVYICMLKKDQKSLSLSLSLFRILFRSVRRRRNTLETDERRVKSRFTF